MAFSSCGTDFHLRAQLEYLVQSLGAALPVVGFKPFPSPLREVADLFLLASALLRNFEGRPLLPAHDSLRVLYPFIVLMHYGR